MEKKTGIELIAAERQEQIEKHHRTTETDVIENGRHQLSYAASALCSHNKQIIAHSPFYWDDFVWRKMANKPYKERLIIAGALIAAEIDRINAL